MNKNTLPKFSERDAAVGTGVALVVTIAIVTYIANHYYR